MNGIPNSPANGYAPVKNVIVANNTYYDCTSPWSFGVGIGFRNRIAKPENTLLLNNLVYCPNTDELIKYYDQTDGIMLDNNILINNKGNLEIKGTVKGEILQSKLNDLEIIYTTIAAKKIAFVKKILWDNPEQFRSLAHFKQSRKNNQ
jgi:poly(beta-D-mannuronate) lyase